jgi:hypothetical protein
MRLLAALLLLASAIRAADKPRIFLAGSDPVQVTGEALTGDVKSSLAVTRSGASGDVTVIKTFLERCPGVVVTTDREKASYVVHVETDSPNPTTPFVRANKAAVFDRNGEIVYATSARLLRNAVKSACAAILARGAQ